MRTRPFHVTIDITDKCNFGCTYCYKGDEHPDRVADPQTVLHALDKAWPRVQAQGGLSLGFMGGEPLVAFSALSETVREAGSRCQSEGLKFGWGMTSNLSLLGDRQALFAKETGGSVYTSLDGDRKSHNLNRPFATGKDSFDAVMRGVQTLKRHGLQGGVRMTITPATLPMLTGNIAFLASLGFQGISAFPAIDNGGWTEKDFAELQKQARMLAAIRHTTLGKVHGVYPFDTYAFAARHEVEGVNHHCRACRTSLSMDVDGRFYPCHRMTGLPEADHLRIDGLEHWEEVKKVFDHDLDPKCQECPVLGACFGGCWAESLKATGDITEPHGQHCQYNTAFFDAIYESDYQDPRGLHPKKVIAGEGSCVLKDICVACDCNSPDCGGRDSCGQCDVVEPEPEMRLSCRSNDNCCHSWDADCNASRDPSCGTVDVHQATEDCTWTDFGCNCHESPRCTPNDYSCGSCDIDN